MLALFTMPVYVLYYVSLMEQAQYDMPRNDVQLKEMSYGVPSQVIYKDFYEKITLAGTVISTDVVYEELEIPQGADFRLRVSVSQVVVAGDIIGYCNGEPVIASSNGVVKSINLGTYPYIELYDIDKLVIECYVDDDTLKVLNRKVLDLIDENGNNYDVIRVDDIKINGNKTRVLISCENNGLSYGQVINNMELNTGRVYTNSTMVLSKCIYSLDGGNTHYVRLVDSEGNFIKEQSVEIGFSTGMYTIVSGVEVGQYCDSAYKAVVEGR
ncbi:MAG: hypothetical protein IKV30_01240 [Clostridia bacterium]|nr:hypothetical protein [Clostridia bacterium]